MTLRNRSGIKHLDVARLGDGNLLDPRR